MAAIDDFMQAISGQESGGNSTIVNDDSGAHGIFQIMPGNWPSWSREAGIPGAPRTAGNQIRVARFKMLQYYRQFGSWEAVAVAWYSGPGRVAAWKSNRNQPLFTNRQGGGKYPSINSYVSQVMGRMGRASGSTAMSAPAGSGGPAPSGGGAPPAPARLAQHATEAQIVDFIVNNYGPAQVAMLREPELRAALLNAARAGITGEARFMVEVEKTQWWQARSEAMRTWDILKMADPREAADRLEKRKALLAPLWESYGVDADINFEAEHFERLGLNEQQLTLRVADSLQQESSQSGLDQGTKAALSADALMKIARMEYLTPLSRQQVEQWAIRGVRQGEDMEQAFRQFVSSIASARFGITAASGITPADVLAPIKIAIAQSLEISPDTIDLLDDEYSGVLQVENEKGGFRAMTASEATVWARSKESFKGTQVARDTSAELAERLGQTFGKVA